MTDNIKNVLSLDVIELLIQKAFAAREFSYSPYSGFGVGAALLVDDKSDNNCKDEHKKAGKDEAGQSGIRIYTGCNIENAAYSPGNCAERTAVFKAVSEGYTGFRAIAIVGGPVSGALDYTSPCGVCRQVLREFVNPKEFYVIMARNNNDYIIKTLDELLPMSFGAANLGM